MSFFSWNFTLKTSNPVALKHGTKSYVFKVGLNEFRDENTWTSLMISGNFDRRNSHPIIFYDATPQK